LGGDRERSAPNDKKKGERTNSASIFPDCKGYYDVKLAPGNTVLRKEVTKGEAKVEMGRKGGRIEPPHELGRDS